ncbi:hypothetical protein [Cellulomonas biazotea]|jgi:hypothetical protein|uniref:Integral membrane protein n=1 Tax=Cellulomonas biazotea TaxID=1709 RepID=A0A402DT65_9CELL|nr:hypothetical protein [Cellulomonas biazotea]GCE77339.1 hypothetical protein CBZ_23950 [Cellulomonas biazotea]
METLQHLLLLLHLLGWAIVFGGTLVTLRDTRLPKGALHGILTALVTGILMVGLASASDELRDPNNVKVAVKLVVALVVTGLVVYGTRRPEKVTRGLLGAVLGLTVVNVAIAVLWR